MPKIDQTERVNQVLYNGVVLHELWLEHFELSSTLIDNKLRISKYPSVFNVEFGGIDKNCGPRILQHCLWMVSRKALGNYIPSGVCNTIPAPETHFPSAPSKSHCHFFEGGRKKRALEVQRDHHQREDLQ